jgi:hypothetical protein
MLKDMSLSIEAAGIYESPVLDLILSDFPLRFRRDVANPEDRPPYENQVASLFKAYMESQNAVIDVRGVKEISSLPGPVIYRNEGDHYYGAKTWFCCDGLYIPSNVLEAGSPYPNLSIFAGARFAEERYKAIVVAATVLGGFVRTVEFYFDSLQSGVKPPEYYGSVSDNRQFRVSGNNSELF